MDTSSFGFWASAIGGILIGISWARARGNNPVDREVLIKSLQHRLEFLQDDLYSADEVNAKAIVKDFFI
jgi:hypothetical protein